MMSVRTKGLHTSFFVVQFVVVFAAGASVVGLRDNLPPLDGICDAASAPDPHLLATAHVDLTVRIERHLQFRQCAGATSTSSRLERIRPSIEQYLSSGHGGTMSGRTKGLHTSFFVVQFVVVFAAGASVVGLRDNLPPLDGICDAASAPDPHLLATAHVDLTVRIERHLQFRQCAGATSTSSRLERIRPSIEQYLSSGHGGTMSGRTKGLHTSFFVVQFVVVFAAGASVVGLRDNLPPLDGICDAASAPDPHLLATAHVDLTVRIERHLQFRQCAGATSTSSRLERIRPSIEQYLSSGHGGTMSGRTKGLHTSFFVVQFVVVFAAGASVVGLRDNLPPLDGICDAASAPDPHLLATAHVDLTVRIERHLLFRQCAGATSTSSRLERIRPSIQQYLSSGHGGTMSGRTKGLHTSFFVVQFVVVFAAGASVVGLRDNLPPLDGICDAASAPDPHLLATAHVDLTVRIERHLQFRQCAVRRRLRGRRIGGWPSG
ncbi:uncharacterized protein [Dermacentor albipictus]|uniref:uncharacterized protein n=1 Tax=Dermacentor albipictus TaxID=60249 RepID=UPI0038FC976C